MTEDQREMVDFLTNLCQQVERGEVAGLALGIISPAKLIQTAVLGACSREPVQTLGIVRLMSRAVEDHMLLPESTPAAPDPAPPRKSRKS